MKNAVFYTLLFIFYSLSVPGQDAVFRGRLIDESTDRGVPGVLVSLVGFGQKMTDDEGMFQIAITPNTDQVQIELPDGWEIRSHLDGKVLVPRSSSQFQPIRVKPVFSEYDQLRRDLARMREENRLKAVQIDSLEQLVKDSINWYRNQIKVSSYESRTETNRAAAEAETLRQKVDELTRRLEARYTELNKAELRGTVSGELLVYLDKLKDLRDFLPNFRDVFLFPQASENFDQLVTAYNEARAPIYENQQGRLAEVALYWEDPVLTDDLEEVYDLILNGIHKESVLPMNDELIGLVRAYVAGRMPRVQANRKAHKKAKTAYDTLAAPIESLEKKIGEVNGHLSH